VHGELGHLVEGHLLHNQLPDLQLELLAKHQLHGLLHLAAVVDDASVAGPARLEVELHLKGVKEERGYENR